MRVLILGANSFLGSSFIAHLLTNGQHDIIATSRSEQATPIFLPYRWTGLNGLRFEQIDLNSDRHLDRLVDIIDTDKPTHIANFAALSMVAESWTTPADYMETNVVALTKLVDMLRSCYDQDGDGKWPFRFLHVTTPEVYGSLDGWTHEDAEFNPSTPYAVSRAAGDMLLATYVRQYDFPVVFARPGNVYGPGQRPYRIIAKTILSVARGQKLTLDGGGTSERAFLHASDNSDALYRVMKKGRIGECYHVSGYEAVSIRQVVKKVLDRLFKPFDEWVVVGPERPGLDAAYKLDSSKIRTELGWRDKIALDDDLGIASVIQWSRRFATELADVPLTYEHKR